MGLTPDRHPGSPDYETEVQFSDESMGDPTVLGAARYTQGSFRYKDAISVFDSPPPWINKLDGPSSDLAGVTFYKVVTGTIPVSRVDWYRNAALTSRSASCVYTYSATYPLLPTQIVTTLYKVDGTTVLRTCTDSIAYAGVFETGRTRVFS